MQVALVDGKIVRYAVAEALPDEEFTWWRGITVDSEYEKRGVGRALEAKRHAWATDIGRPVRVRIPTSNKRSLTFFRDQGFMPVATEAPTLNRPLPFTVMELRLPSPQPVAITKI